MNFKRTLRKNSNFNNNCSCQSDSSSKNTTSCWKNWSWKTKDCQWCNCTVNSRSSRCRSLRTRSLSITPSTRTFKSRTAFCTICKRRLRMISQGWNISSRIWNVSTISKCRHWSQIWKKRVNNVSFWAKNGMNSTHLLISKNVNLNLKKNKSNRYRRKSISLREARKETKNRSSNMRTKSQNWPKSYNLANNNWSKLKIKFRKQFSSKKPTSMMSWHSWSRCSSSSMGMSKIKREKQKTRSTSWSSSSKLKHRSSDRTTCLMWSWQMTTDADLISSC